MMVNAGLMFLALRSNLDRLVWSRHVGGVLCYGASVLVFMGNYLTVHNSVDRQHSMS